MKLLLDVDTGIDDALAQIYLADAARRGEVELLGATTVAGNVGVARTTRNTLKIWEMLGLEIPVAAGAERPLTADLCTAPFVHGDDGLGNTGLAAPKSRPLPEHAADFLIRVSREHAGELTLLTTAPLTNVALALLRDPGLAGRLARVVTMGGAVFGGNVSAVAEANIANDPEAARIVMRSGANLTMIGLDVTHRVYLEENDLKPLTALDNERADFLLRIIRFIVEAYHRLSGQRRCVLHDPLAAAVALDPTLVSTELCHVDVELRGELTRGMTVVDRRGREPLGEPNVRVALAVDAPRFKKRFIETLLAWARGN